MTEASFIRYLAAKRTVDDRALNRRVWDAMVSAAGGGSPRVLEIGGGIGTMIQRVIDDGRLAPRSWTLMDADAALIAEAKRRLAGTTPFPVEHAAAELDAFIDTGPAPFDLVIANAVLDLFDPARILPRMARLSGPAGCSSSPSPSTASRRWSPRSITLWIGKSWRCITRAWTNG